MVAPWRKLGEGLRRTRETWFQQVNRLFAKEDLDESIWAELEEALLGADVGLATTQRILEELRERARKEGIHEPAALRRALGETIGQLLTVAAPAGDSLSTARPYVILVVGVNGTGKTTSIAKLAAAYRQEGKRVLLVAADTFRAAAIDQLRVWGERAKAEVIAHQPGADPGAVVFDALQAATHRGFDVVIVDTAGRLHTKSNLMEELKKVRRVIARVEPSAPHEVLLVLDATIGQNGLAQARHFLEAIGVTGLVLAKLDGTAKGGVVLAIATELHLPLRYVGTGEGLSDLAVFEPRAFAEALLSTA